MSGSVSFDRAAAYYDATREFDDETYDQIFGVLERELRDRGRILEIGVGTGQLAIPLHERGIDVVGIDLSASMMSKIAEKSGGRSPLPLVRGDATRLPFADDTFGGAYARWVLHLIPNWRDAVAELVRVVRTDGVIVIDPGGYTGTWRELWIRFVEECGPDAEPVGLDMQRGSHELDEAFAALGKRRRDMDDITYRTTATLSSFFDETASHMYSWTWRVSDEDLERACRVVRAWAQERYGDQLLEPEPYVSLPWRAYDLASTPSP